MARNRELEVAIQREPADLERFLVYGDWLAQRGNPRGALMVTGAELARAEGPRAVELQRAYAALWREHEAEITGELAGLAHHGLELTWRMGCVFEARLTAPPDDAGTATLAKLIHHEAAFALQGLHIDTAALGEHGFNYQPLVDIVAEEAPLSLRDLSLGAIDGWTEGETVVLGDLRPLLGRHQGLRELALAGRASTVSAPWAMPELAALSLRPVGLSRTWSRVIHAEIWPALERLDFSYVSALDADIGWLRSSRLTVRFPRLTHLGVIGTGDALGVIEALGATGLGRQLVELDVRYGAFADEALARLEEDRNDFPRLERLVGVADPSRGPSWLDVRSG